MARTPSPCRENGMHSLFSARVEMKDACVDRLYAKHQDRTKKICEEDWSWDRNRWNNNGIKNALSVTASERLFMLLGTRSPSASAPIYLWCTNDRHIGHITSINYCYYYLQPNFMMFIMGTILMIATVDEHTFVGVIQVGVRWTVCEAIQTTTSVDAW